MTNYKQAEIESEAAIYAQGTPFTGNELVKAWHTWRKDDERLQDFFERYLSENSEVFSGKNYSIEYKNDGQFVLVGPVSENETFDSFDELVESHPVCEEAREFFFGM